MPDAAVGFAVLYRWRLHPGKETEFEQAWETVTRLLMARRGALGSRLHRAADGTWVAYAQWPNRQAWEDSRAQESVDPGAGAIMSEAISKAFEPVLLEPVCDHLVAGTIRKG